MELEEIINQIQVKELSIGDHIRTEEMTTFQKIIKLEQDPYFENCLRITLDVKIYFSEFQVINKTQFVEFRKTI